MTPDNLDALFDDFRSTVVRLEGLPAYEVADYEGDRLRAFLAGAALPVRSVKTDPWLARIARTSTAGKVWQRVRVVDEPLTDYERFELAVYPETQAVGEDIRIVTRSKVGPTGPDVWLFDRGSAGACAVEMHYDDRGRWRGVELIDGEQDLAVLTKRIAQLWGRAMPLNEFLAMAGG